MCAQFSPQVQLTLSKVEEPVSNDNPSSDEERAPNVDLTLLPFSFRLYFLALATFSVIVCADLSTSQMDSLLIVLRLHCKPMAYTLDVVKGTHPIVCMHRILMEDDLRPSSEYQRRLNPNMKKWSRKKF